MRKLLIILFLLSTTACTSITKQAVPIAAIEKPQPGNALIIVERKYEHSASAHEVEVKDNGEVIGLLGVGYGEKDNRKHHQLVWQRPEGEMRLELTPAFIVNNASPISEKVEAGKTYTYTVGFSYFPYGIMFLKK